MLSIGFHEDATDLGGASKDMHREFVSLWQL
jgi:hypothetical protein